MSSPAFADSGTVPCRYTYATAATATTALTRPANNQGRFVVTTTAPGGTCPCGSAAPTVTYAYFGTLIGNATVTASSNGWSAASTFDSGALAIGGGNSAFDFNVQVGVRVQCSDSSGQPTFVCRFFTFAGANAPTTVGPSALADASAAGLPGC
jgi:hypothetical protein